jgi:uncharacterized protein
MPKINRSVQHSTNIVSSFPVRRMDYQFHHMTKYWCKNDPVYTHFFTALSTLFPEGEAFFVRSVRHFRKHIDNPVLDKDIGAFIGQEAMHSKEHHAFHQSAQQYGLDVESLEKITGITLKTIEQLFPKKWNLLLTVGIEHYTAVLVRYMMSDVNKMIGDETIRNLWLWHSIEETEHKAVAFDLYQELYGTKLDAYIPRVTLFTMSLVLVTVLTHISQISLLYRDKQLLNLKSWRSFLKFGVKSYAIFLPQFLEFYRFDFHPNDTDESNLVNLTKAKLSLLN